MRAEFAEWLQQLNGRVFTVETSLDLEHAQVAEPIGALQ